MERSFINNERVHVRIRYYATILPHLFSRTRYNIVLRSRSWSVVKEDYACHITEEYTKLIVWPGPGRWLDSLASMRSGTGDQNMSNWHRVFIFGSHCPSSAPLLPLGGHLISAFGILKHNSHRRGDCLVLLQVIKMSRKGRLGGNSVAQGVNNTYFYFLKRRSGHFESKTWHLCQLIRSQNEISLLQAQIFLINIVPISGSTSWANTLMAWLLEWTAK